MGWLTKKAYADRIRVHKNLQRLESLKDKVHELSFFVMSSQSGGFEVLKNLVEDQLVKGRPYVHDKLSEALIGENNQKMALDSPSRFQRIMQEAEELIKREIGKEKLELRKLDKENDESTG